MAKAAVLNIDIVASADKAISAFDQLKSKSGAGWSAMKGAALGASTAIIGQLGAATQAAMEDQVQTEKLTQSYRNLGLPVADVGDALDQIDASARKTGLSADESVEAFNSLVVATKDSGTAMKDLSVAQDLAAMKGISVEAAAKAIIGAHNGQTRALKELGIATKDQDGNALTSAQIMDQLTNAVKGQADAYGNTATGQMAAFHETLGQIQESIGAALLPAIQALLDLLQPLLTFLQEHEALARVLVPLVVGLAGAVVGVSVAVKVWTAAQTALNLVMSANPIGLVIVAIAALAAGVIYAYNHFEPFRNAVQWVWDILKSFGAWIGANWRLIVGALLGPVGLLILNFDKVTDAVKKLIEWLGKIKDAASNALGWLGKVGGSIVSKIPGLSAMPGGPTATPMGSVAYVAVYVQPGDAFPEAVYRGLKEYQRRHVRPELAPLFGGR